MVFSSSMAALPSSVRTAPRNSGSGLRRRDIDGHRLTDRFAVVQRFHHREVFFVGVDHVGDLEQDVGSLCRVDIFPALPGFPRRGHGKVNILPRSLGALGQYLSIGRTVGLEVFAVACRPPFSVDKQSILLLQFRFFVKH
ncbi:MAG: hypothetical protein ACLUEQ_05285 [Cloacibacillus evryensis]